MSPSVSTTEPRTAALTILATMPPPVAADDAAAPEDPRVTLIRAANAEASQIAKSLAERLKAGEDAGDAGRALKLALAKARLQALRLAAVMAAAARDGKRALGIAKEVAEVARELKAMAESNAPDPEIPTAADPTTPASAADPAATAPAAPTPAPTLAAANAPSPEEAEINGLLAHARATLTIARKAAKPGSEEERKITGLLSQVGTPSLEADLTPAAESTHIDLSV